jgi:tripartite-type tricarboxylate transporter receptor subunit TctC
MFAPAGTPKPVVDKLSEALFKIVSSPDFTQRVVAIGGRPRPEPADKFRNYVRSEVGRWANVIRESNARAD